MAADVAVEADCTDHVPFLVMGIHPAGAAVDNLHAADAVLYHHNPPDVAAVHTVPDGPRQEVHRTAAEKHNRPAAGHTDRVVVEARRRIAAEERRMIAVMGSPRRRSGRSSLVAVVERRRIGCLEGSQSRRQRCRSSRWRTL